MYHHLKKKCKTVSSLFSTHFQTDKLKKKKRRRIENLFRRLFNTLCNFNNSFLLNRKETRLSFLPVKNNPKPWTVFLLPWESYTIREGEFFSREIYQDFSKSESPRRFKTIDSFFSTLHLYPNREEKSPVQRSLSWPSFLPFLLLSRGDIVLERKRRVWKFIQLDVPANDSRCEYWSSSAN